ncbi:MAG: MarR family transcriptional regulator [Pseudomonadota bacterium]
MRRTFERLNGNVTDLYRREAAFEQRWFSLGMLLAEKGAINSADAAAMLGQSHVAMVQVVRAMEKSDLLQRTPHPDDRRSKLLALTPTGRERLQQVSQISDKVQRAAEKLLAEAAPDFMEMLDALDDALDRQDFAARIEAEFSNQKEAEK